MRLKKSYSFDDVMLVPRLSHLKTRAAADLSTTVAGVKLKIPIIAANMSSVCEELMAKTLGKLGGLGIVHRMCSPEEQQQMIIAAKTQTTPPEFLLDYPVGFSIGIGDDWRIRMDACKGFADIACLDIAHAHHERVLDLLHKYFGIYKNYPLIIGQVSTPSAVCDLLHAVPEKYHSSIAFKTSIGGGSLCTTRIKTGFGIPTLQSIMDIYAEFPNVCIIGDGGIKESGDIVKSLAAGASAVMLGNLLAGTDEAPGKIIKAGDGQLYKVYRGSASFGDKALRNEETRNIEGEETLVPYKGNVTRVVNGLLDGIRSGFSYGGALNIAELQDGIEFQEISIYGYQESLPHGK
jgi:IMP dehydrogenase